MKLNLEIKTKRDRDNLVKQLASMSFENHLSDDLTVTHYRNGDEIVEVKTFNQFHELGKSKVPAFIINPKGGYLYNWFAVNDERGLAPEGFHIPSKDEWDDLEDDLKVKPTYNGYVNNIGFYSIGFDGNWWSSSASSSFCAWARLLSDSNHSITRYSHYRQCGFSVRVVKD